MRLPECQQSAKPSILQISIPAMVLMCCTCQWGDQTALLSALFRPDAIANACLQANLTC
jgi:hypothetical protein